MKLESKKSVGRKFNLRSENTVVIEHAECFVAQVFQIWLHLLQKKTYIHNAFNSDFEQCQSSQNYTL